MAIIMKALRSFGYGKVNEGPVSRGHEFAVRDEFRAKELEAHGLAYRLDTKIEAKPASVVAPENKVSSEGPLPSAGGKTGAAEPAPSSPPDPRPRRRRSRSSEGGLLS